MSKLSEMQIYATIRGCQATADRAAADGRTKAAAAARRRAERYRAELRERLDFMLAHGMEIQPAIKAASAALGDVA